MEKIRAYFLFGLFFILVTSAFAEKSPQGQVQKAYEDWCATISKAKGNASEIIKFYAPNAVLLPTLSRQILFNNNDGKKNAYFTMLTSHPDIKCTTNKLITRTYGPFAVTTGLYTFSYIKNHKKESIPARFTFVYQKVGDKWLIVNHHSSVLPSG